MDKKIVLRRCVVTNEMLPKKELLRVVKNKDGEVLVDLNGKTNGHGAYLKKDLDVIKKAKESKVLDRTLETKVSDDIYDKLIKLL